jgi:uncharacterized sulfatase
MRFTFLALLIGVIACSPTSLFAADGPSRPNILWLTTEDIGPQLGCYGDTYATTPNLDKFAARSLQYQIAWSNAPVCAPARTTIITGVYPTATGGEHMRSMIALPQFMKMYPTLLREAGYYCTNNSKEDYNVSSAEKKPWDESSKNAHWKNRPAGKPFMAVFNHLGTHESQIRTRPHKWVHDISKAPLPAYHPDTLEARQDWAQYYDNITVMDEWFAKMLKEVEDAGLADDTIVFFYGDHGSGMPRSKRWPYNSGLQVPFLVHIPEKWKHLAPDNMIVGKTDRLVSFVDLAPTLCSLAGVKPPEWMQGHGFLGSQAAPPQKYLFGFRGRMDERTDLVRSVRDNRYIYIRNYMPHRIYGQYLDYMFKTPTTKVWHDLYAAGKLKPPQTYFWERKPIEELYDLQNDKDEIHNLADSASPEHQAKLKELKGVLREWILQTHDVGFLPEGEIHSRPHAQSAYEYGHSDRYPLQRILQTAELASYNTGNDALDLLQRALKDEDSAVRYWAAIGLMGREGKDGLDALRGALKDESPYVRAIAAEALGRYGTADDLKASLDTLIAMADVKKNGVFVGMAALQGIDALGDKAMPLKEKIAALPLKDPNAAGRYAEYPTRLFEHITATLGKP